MKSKILLATVKNIFIFSVICITLSSCGTSEEALETKRLLDKLQAKTEVGINQNEYGNAVADLIYASRQIKNLKEKKAFEKIIKIHEITYTFWQECSSYDYPYSCFSNGGMKPILESFPEIKDKQNDYAITQDHGSEIRIVWHTDSVIQELWAMANSELETIKY